jgi:hypothetical protein
MAPPKKKAKKLAAGSDEPEERVVGRLVLANEPPSMLDGKAHVGLAIGLSTDNNPSALILPDISGLVEGTQPVFLAKPLKLNLIKIKDYLKAKSPESAKAMDGNKALEGFLTNTAVEVNSFYFRKGREKQAADAPNDKAAVDAVSRLMLMEFNVDFQAGKKKAEDQEKADKAAGKPTVGLIGSLTGDPALSELFEITSLSLRVLQCDEDNVEALQNYIDLLSKE